jgi:hypothetical protein
VRRAQLDAPAVGVEYPLDARRVYRVYARWGATLADAWQARRGATLVGARQARRVSMLAEWSA